MPENPASAFIDALKEALDVESDENLAKYLNIGKSTLASWRKRESVPKKARDEYSKMYGVPYDRSAARARKDDNLIKLQLNTAFYLAIMRLSRHIKEEELVGYASWLAEKDRMVKLFLEAAHNNGQHLSDKPEEFTKMLLHVARGEYATPEELITWKAEMEGGSD